MILHFLKRFRRGVCALLALWILFAAAFAETAGANQIMQTAVEATCTEPGYILINDLDAGTTRVEHLPAPGHDYSDWVPDEETNTRNRVCGVCGYQETIRISTADEESMPKLYLKGSMEGIGKKSKVALEAEFVSQEQSFRCYAIMTLQGHSTFGYPKHNYTVRFYDDPQSVRKHRLQFQNWRSEHKYILKANYIDLSQCRNLVAAQIWSGMAACRENLSPRIASLPSYGAVTGFPVAVYLNGDFFGLYTMNLHKDDQLYGMENGGTAALIICNQESMDEALFRAKAAFLEDYTSDWEIEYCSTENEKWAQESFHQLIDFVMHSSDQTFREELHKHLDVDAAIDYLIFLYALGLQHGGAKDLVLLNYGDVWIPSAYDMDEAFGLDAAAYTYLPAQAFLPEKEADAWLSGTGSLLWDRLLTAFEQDIRERYVFLRRDVLSEKKFRSL